jgi:hypothetical protein
VNSIVNFRGLHPTPGEMVLNGIAYDKQHDRLFVTGKNWEDMFEVRVNEPTVATSLPTQNTVNSEIVNATYDPLVGMQLKKFNYLDDDDYYNNQHWNESQAGDGSGNSSAIVLLVLIAVVGCGIAVFRSKKKSRKQQIPSKIEVFTDDL